MASITLTTPAVTEAKDNRRKSYKMMPFGFGHRRKPPSSFWSRLCDHCRAQSVCLDVSRDLPPHTAWNPHGPVKAHWTECLFPIVLQYLQTNRKQICGCQAWNGSIDCYMLGEEPLSSRPCIIVTCLVERSRKRLIRMLQKDSTIAQSGFEVMGRSGNLRFKMKDDNSVEKNSTESLPDGDESWVSVACGLPITDHPYVSERTKIRLATVGGLVTVGSELLALTVSHVLPKDMWEGTYPDHGAEQKVQLFDHDSSTEDLEESDEDDEAVDPGLLEHDCRTWSVNPYCFANGDEDTRLKLWHYAEGQPALGRAYDWALLQFSPGAYMSHANSTYRGSSILNINSVALCAPEDEQVLVLSNRFIPTQAYCSGTPSFIACGQFAGLAYEIRTFGRGERLEAGISGSWVVNQVSGDLYGVIVAGSSSKDQAYMVRASDVFADIARTCGVEPKLPSETSDAAVAAAEAVRETPNQSTDFENSSLYDVNDVEEVDDPSSPREMDELREDNFAKDVPIQPDSDAIVPGLEGTIQKIEIVTVTTKNPT